MNTPCRIRGTYRKYNRDATIPFPRSTFWRYRHQLSSARSQHMRPSRSPQSASLSTSPLDSRNTYTATDDQQESDTNSGSSTTHTSSASCSPPNSSSVSPLPTSPLSAEVASSTSVSSPSLYASADSSDAQCDTSSPSSSSSGSHSEMDDSMPDCSHLFEPLYTDAEVTVCGAICAIMVFCTKYKLPYVAIGGLLKLLCVLCPNPNHLPSSFYAIRKFFQQFSSVHDQQVLCSKCYQSSCSCATSHMAHLVHLDIQKPLERIVSGMYLHVAI